MSRRRNKKQQQQEQAPLQQAARHPDYMPGLSPLHSMVAKLRGIDAEVLQKAVDAAPDGTSSRDILAAAEVLNPTQSFFTAEDTEQSSFHRKYHRKGAQRLTDELLGEIAQQDPDVASIITTRITQVTGFASNPVGRFDKGIKIVDQDELSINDFDSDEDAFKKEMDLRKKEKQAVFEWFMTCGTTDEKVLDGALANHGRWMRKHSLKDYMQSQARNLLTYGRCARENMWVKEQAKDMLGNPILDSAGQPVTHRVPGLFRPVPVEQVMPSVYKGIDPAAIDADLDSNQFSEEEVKEYNKMSEEEREAAYFQVHHGQRIGFFKDDSIEFSYWQRQANYDYQIFPLSPIEQAIATVYLNHCVYTHLKNKFQSGSLARSMLVVKPMSDKLVGANKKDIQEMVRSLGKMGRIENSGVIPVLSAPVNVDVVDFAPKTDSEWENVKQANKRALLSAFQIAAKEVSWGNLGDSAGIAQSNAAEEWVQGEERGLRILMDIILEDLNQVADLKFPGFTKRYRFEVQGLGLDNRENADDAMRAAMETVGTMNDMISLSDKNDALALGGDIPLNEAWHNNGLRFAEYWEIRKYYYGDKDAEKREDWHFIIDPSLEQMRQQRIMQEETIKQNKLQTKLMEMQVQQAEQPQPAMPGAAPGGGDGEQSVQDLQGKDEQSMVQKSLKIWGKQEH